MTEKHTIICDRCGKEAKMANGAVFPNSYNLPINWHKDDEDRDLCSKCWSDRKKYLKQFK